MELVTMNGAVHPEKIVIIVGEVYGVMLQVQHLLLNLAIAVGVRPSAMGSTPTQADGALLRKNGVLHAGGEPGALQAHGNPLPMHPLPLLFQKLLPPRATGIAAEVLVVVPIFHLREITKGLHTATAMPCSKPLKAIHTGPNSMVPLPSLKHSVEAIG